MSAAPTIEQLRADLAMQANGWRSMGAPPGAWGLLEFVLREGIDCIAQPRPARYRQAMPKRCFANTRRLVRRAKGLSYCEGYVSCAPVPIAIHHAWAIDSERRVIDVTLADPECCAYLGVAFSSDELHRWSFPESASLLLDSNECIAVELIRARCPGLLGDAA